MPSSKGANFVLWQPHRVTSKMGASDKYCCISATHWLHTPNKLIQQICDVMDWDCDDDERVGNDGRSKIGFDPALVDGLRLKEEDMVAANDFILLCNVKEEGGDRVVYDSVYVQGNNPKPAFISEKNITARWHVEADVDATDNSTFYTEKGEIVYAQNVSFLVNYPAFLIVSGVSPGLIKLHTLYDLLYHHSRQRPWKPISLNGSYYAQPERYYVRNYVTTNPLSSVNYGPLVTAVGQEVVYAYLPASHYEDAKGAEQFWGTLLPDETISVADKLQEIWFGKGNFWCTSAPNKFPIAGAVASPPFVALPQRDAKDNPALACLPMEILLIVLVHLPPQEIATLLQTCYGLRQSILPVANSTAYASIRLHRPHLFPVGPFQFETDCDRGSEEIEYWVKKWAEGSFALDEGDWKATKDVRMLPWLAYAREASKSPGMKNRRRIWGIGLQLEGMIKELQQAREYSPASFLPTY